MDPAQSSLAGQVSSSSSDLVSHLDHNQAPNGGHISFFERLPQEILNQIVGLLYSSHPSHACRLLRTSRFLRNGVQRRLYELHLKLSNGLLGWACAWGYENMVRLNWSQPPKPLQLKNFTVRWIALLKFPMTSADRFVVPRYPTVSSNSRAQFTRVTRQLPYISQCFGIVSRSS